MSIIILILICMLLVIRQYAWPYVQAGQLPYSGAFSIFSVFLIVLGLINGIYLFGVGAGIVFCFLISLNIFQLCFLWPFTFVLYVAFYKKVQEGIYVLFPIGTWVLFLLTIINFFVSRYRELGSWLTEDVLKYGAICGIISLIIGQVIIKGTMRILCTLISKNDRI